MRNHSQSGNVVRLRLDFDGRFDDGTFQQSLNANGNLQTLNSLKLVRYNFGTPQWRLPRSLVPVALNIHQNLSDDEFELKILNRDIVPSSDPLLHFDLVYFEGERSSLVLSAHHAIADQRGMMNIIKLSGIPGDEALHILPKTGVPGLFRQLSDTVISTLFILRSHPRSMATLVKPMQKEASPARFRVIKFTNEETIAIDKNAVGMGASLVKVPFYLAATARAVNKILQTRDITEVVYWMPVPQDQRLRGSSGGMPANHLSFLFFRICSVQLENLKQAVEILTKQMKYQIRRGIPLRYSNLMAFFRRMPLGVYLKMINLPSGGAVSSFSYSDLGEIGSEYRNFLSVKVKDIINYPPVPYPPGLTIVFMRFNGALRVVIGFVEEAADGVEINMLEKSLRENLLGEKR